MRARVTMIVDSIVVIVYYVVLLVSIIHEYERLVKPFFPCEKIFDIFSIGII